MEMRTRTPDEIHEELIDAPGSASTRIKLSLGRLLKSQVWYALGVEFRLSPREVQVAKLLTMGYTTKETARALGISVGTTKAHVAGILARLGIRRRDRIPIKLLLASGLLLPNKDDYDTDL